MYYHARESTVLEFTRPHRVREVVEEWTPYHGKLGGEGWQWNGQGKPRYQKEKPRERGDGGEASKAPSLVNDPMLQRTGRQFQNIQKALGLKPKVGPAGAAAVRRWLEDHPAGPVVAALLRVEGVGYDDNGFPDNGAQAFRKELDGRFTKDQLDAASKWLYDTYSVGELANVNQNRWIRDAVRTARPAADATAFDPIGDLQIVPTGRDDIGRYLDDPQHGKVYTPETRPEYDRIPVGAKWLDIDKGDIEAKRATNLPVHRGPSDEAVATLEGLRDRLPDDYRTYQQESGNEDEPETVQEYLRDQHGIEVRDDGLVEFDRLTPQARQIISDQPVVVLHHTSTAVLSQIAQQGLRAAGGDVKTANPYKNTAAGVYVTTQGSGSVVDGYKNVAVQAHGGEPVTLEIRTTLDSLTPDPDDEELGLDDRQFILPAVPPSDILNLPDLLPDTIRTSDQPETLEKQGAEGESGQIRTNLDIQQAIDGLSDRLAQQGITLRAHPSTEDQSALRLDHLLIGDAAKQGAGLGTAAFRDVVALAQQQGFRRITLEATRDDDLNGYYAFARLGADGLLPTPLAREAQEAGFDAMRVSDLMETPEGRAWWRENGDTVELAFDLTPGSESMRRLESYEAERSASSTPRGTAAIQRHVESWTPEQKMADWKAKGVRGASFKSFFGDWEYDPETASKVVDSETGEPKETAEISGEGSKVTDQDGNPVAVYHGTASGGFTAFDKRYINDDNLYGPGFYFTEDKQVADEYQSKEGLRGVIRGEPAVVAEEARWRLRQMLVDAHGRVADVYLKNAPEWRKVDDLANYYGDELLLDTLKFDAASGGLKWFAKEGQDLSDLVGTTGETKAVYLNIRRPFDIDNDELSLDSITAAPESVQAAVRSFREAELQARQTDLEAAEQTVERHRDNITRFRQTLLDKGYDPEAADPADMAWAPTLRQDRATTAALIRQRFTEAGRAGEIRDASDEDLVREVESTGRLAFPGIDTRDLYSSQIDPVVASLYLDWSSEQAILADAQATADKAAQRLRSPIAATVKQLEQRQLVAKEINAMIRAAGYDGLTHIGGDRMGDGHHHRVWIAFEPQQIKAVENRGTFGPTDNMYESRGRVREQVAFEAWDESKYRRDEGGRFARKDEAVAAVGGQDIGPDEEVEVVVDGWVSWTGPKREADQMVRDQWDETQDLRGISIHRPGQGPRAPERVETPKPTHTPAGIPIPEVSHDREHAPGGAKWRDPPEVMYHATFSAPEIEQGGFKPLNELDPRHRVLGGSDQTSMSLTTRENAELYRDGLATARQLAQGLVPWDRHNAQLLAHHFGVRGPEFDRLWAEQDRRVGVPDDQRWYDLMQGVSFAGRKFPLFITGGWTDTLKNAPGPPRLVKVARGSAEQFMYNDGETEWKVSDPEKLRVLGVESAVVAATSTPRRIAESFDETKVKRDDEGQFAKQEGRTGTKAPVATRGIGDTISIAGQEYRVKTYDAKMRGGGGRPSKVAQLEREGESDTILLQQWKDGTWSLYRGHRTIEKGQPDDWPMGDKPPGTAKGSKAVAPYEEKLQRFIKPGGKVNLRGFDQESAAEVVSALESLYDGRDFPLLEEIVAKPDDQAVPAKFISSPYNNGKLVLNSKALGKKDVSFKLAEEEARTTEMVRRRLADGTMPERLRAKAEQLLSFPRQLADPTIRGIVTHEIGHAIDHNILLKDRTRRAKVLEGWQDKARRLSARAFDSEGEYLAESLAAHRAGLEIAPEAAEWFKELGL